MSNDVDFIMIVFLKQELEKKLPNCIDMLESKRILKLINKLDDQIDKYIEYELIKND